MMPTVRSSTSRRLDQKIFSRSLISTASRNTRTVWLNFSGIEFHRAVRASDTGQDIALGFGFGGQSLFGIHAGASRQQPRAAGATLALPAGGWDLHALRFRSLQERLAGVELAGLSRTGELHGSGCRCGHWCGIRSGDSGGSVAKTFLMDLFGSHTEASQNYPRGFHEWTRTTNEIIVQRRLQYHLVDEIFIYPAFFAQPPGGRLRANDFVPEVRA